MFTLLLTWADVLVVIIVQIELSWYRRCEEHNFDSHQYYRTVIKGSLLVINPNPFRSFIINQMKPIVGH